MPIVSFPGARILKLLTGQDRLCVDIRDEVQPVLTEILKSHGLVAWWRYTEGSGYASLHLLCKR